MWVDGTAGYMVVAHVIIVSAPVQKIGFGVFQTWSGLWGQDRGPVGTGDWDLDLGLTIYFIFIIIRVGMNLSTWIYLDKFI